MSVCRGHCRLLRLRRGARRHVWRVQTRSTSAASSVLLQLLCAAVRDGTLDHRYVEHSTRVRIRLVRDVSKLRSHSSACRDTSNHRQYLGTEADFMSECKRYAFFICAASFLLSISLRSAAIEPTSCLFSADCRAYFCWIVYSYLHLLGQELPHHKPTGTFSGYSYSKLGNGRACEAF